MSDGAVGRWIAADPDAADRAELEALVASSPHDAGAAAELADRFAGPLRFGTAGLRAAVGAGPSRMNVAVATTFASGLARWLTARGRAGSVVVGCDARHRSAPMAAAVAEVLAGAGIRVRFVGERQPTPLLAFAVRHLGADAGVVVTASHNPAGDNGIKVYLDDGAQVRAPADAELEAAIASVGDLRLLPRGDLDGPLVDRPAAAVRDAYLAAVVAATTGGVTPAAAPVVVHTAMHGVGTALFDAAVARAGFPPVHHVAAQAEPDPDFPTVAYPNPEEPGAMDLALAHAAVVGADLVVANDPDADRVALAVPDGAGFRVLSGDEVGALLGAAVLDGELATGRVPGDRVVARSLVSSTMLGDIAAAVGARHVETLTGFKHIARAADGVAGARLVFGYEEALGYEVCPAVRDKDGISAGVAAMWLVAADLADGRAPLRDRLAALDARLGVHATRQVTRRLHDAAPTVARLRTAPPDRLGPAEVVGIHDLLHGGRPDLPTADVVVFDLVADGVDRARLVVRPSGTEPKVKAYLEVVGHPGAGRSAADAVLDGLVAAVTELLG